MAVINDIKHADLRMLLTESAQEVFSKMVQMTIHPVDKKEVDFSEEGKHYSAVIGFSGGWKGFVTIECSARLAAKATGKMLYMDPAELGHDEIRDAMGEMVNMIGGKFKSGFSSAFNEGSEAFKMSIPTVTYGQEFHIFAAGDSAQIMVVMDAEKSYVSLDLTLKQSGPNLGSMVLGL